MLTRSSSPAIYQKKKNVTLAFSKRGVRDAGLGRARKEILADDVVVVVVV